MLNVITASMRQLFLHLWWFMNMISSLCLLRLCFSVYYVTLKHFTIYCQYMFKVRELKRDRREKRSERDILNCSCGSRNFRSFISHDATQMHLFLGDSTLQVYWVDFLLSQTYSILSYQHLCFCLYYLFPPFVSIFL